MARLIEYISREEVCRFCNNKKEYCGKEKCPVYKAPAVDAVEVVRCRDCKKISPSVTDVKSAVWCREFRTIMPEDGFCSYGERKNTDGKT